MFFDAAHKSMTSIPSPGTEISKQALSFTEQNMKAAFEHARKLVHATDLQQAMQIQSEFLRSQFTNAGEHMRNISRRGRDCRQGCNESQNRLAGLERFRSRSISALGLFLPA